MLMRTYMFFQVFAYYLDNDERDGWDDLFKKKITKKKNIFF